MFGLYYPLPTLIEFYKLYINNQSLVDFFFSGFDFWAVISAEKS